jgi:hypothetical protein
MSLDYDIDDLDQETEIGFGDEFSEEVSEEFEEIDFDALGIDPAAPTAAKPGSEAKVIMLAARYAAGVPLWHESDCYDHGPGDLLARLARKV